MFIIMKQDVKTIDQTTQGTARRASMEEDFGVSSILSRLNSNMSLMIRNRRKFINIIKPMDIQTTEQVLYNGNFSDLSSHFRLRLNEYKHIFGEDQFKLLDHVLRLIELIFLDRVIQETKSVHFTIYKTQMITELRKKITDTKINFNSALQGFQDSERREKFHEFLILMPVEDYEQFYDELAMVIKSIRKHLKKYRQKKIFYEFQILCFYLQIGLYFKKWQNVVFSALLINEIMLQKIIYANGSAQILKYFEDASVEDLIKEFRLIYRR